MPQSRPTVWLILYTLAAVLFSSVSAATSITQMQNHLVTTLTQQSQQHPNCQPTHNQAAPSAEAAANHASTKPAQSNSCNAETTSVALQCCSVSGSINFALLPQPFLATYQPSTRLLFVSETAQYSSAVAQTAYRPPID